MGEQNVVLYGAGGAGRELAHNLSLGNIFEAIGFIDDTKSIGEVVDSLPVLGGLKWLHQYKGNVAVCVVGNPKVKRELIGNIKDYCKDVFFPVIINKHSIVSDFIGWGEGVIVAGPFNHISVGVKLGDFVWINSFDGLGHDVSIGDFTTLYTNIQIGGEASIGRDCVIGTGVVIRPSIKIGDEVIVGGGSVVVKDVPSNVVVVGNPAKILRENK
jgi:sugar O-acyltransferase (sialic acid O-acetyltransferase NeuD family)